MHYIQCDVILKYATLVSIEKLDLISEFAKIKDQNCGFENRGHQNPEIDKNWGLKLQLSLNSLFFQCLEGFCMHISYIWF
jgi:hypothetical protein